MFQAVPPPIIRSSMLHLVGYAWISKSEYINPLTTDWVQCKTRLGVFLNSSQWHSVNNLTIFPLVLWSPHERKLSLRSMYIVFLACCIFFLNSVGPFCTHVSSICPTAKDKKQTRNAVGTQNGRARTILTIQFNSHATIAMNNNTQTNFNHISVLNYIFLFSKILGISFCVAAWAMKNLNEGDFVSLIQSKSMWEYKRLGDHSPNWEKCGYLSHYEKILRLGYLTFRRRDLNPPWSATVPRFLERSFNF